MPQDIAEVFPDIAKHRLLLNTKARVTHVPPEAVIAEVISSVRQPVSYKSSRQNLNKGMVRNV